MLNKSDLIEKLASQPACQDVDVDQMVNIILDQMVQSLANGNRVEIRGFGSFALSVRRAVTARNPKTGERVAVLAKAIPHFKPGKLLRLLVNGTN